MVTGHKENGNFHPHTVKPGVASKSVNAKSTGGSGLKGLPKSFEGYDVMKRKKVIVTKDIHTVTFKNGRKALQGISPLSGNVITRIVG